MVNYSHYDRLAGEDGSERTYKTKPNVSKLILTVAILSITTLLILHFALKSSESNEVTSTHFPASTLNSQDRISFQLQENNPSAIGFDGETKAWVFIAKLGMDKQHNNCSENGKE